MGQAGPPLLQEVLPKAGLVYSEKGNLSEVLCKPKVMAIKSPSLEKLEEMEKAAMDYEVLRASCLLYLPGSGSPCHLTRPIAAQRAMQAEAEAAARASGH